MKGRAMKDSLKKGLIIGAAGSAICVLWHHLLTKKMMPARHGSGCAAGQKQRKNACVRFT